MPYSVVDKPSKFFETKLYTGTGATQSITGLNFSPDWVWIKDRTTAYNHYVYDIIRTPLNVLQTNATDANATQTNGLSAFNSDGFTLLDNRLNVNASGDSFVSWNWLGANTTASNTAGTITSTVSANTTSGFSIVSYTGTGANATVGHGLGVAPRMVIIKNRSSVTNWLVYHASLGNGNSIVLNTTGASFSAGDWQNTTPTSSIIYLSGGTAVNESSSNHIAYCFAEVKGFSKAFSYTGNGSADGTFVYCGFTPAFVLVKNSSTANRQWYIVDNKRSTSNGNNVINKTLAPNQSNDESWWGTNNYVDFVSNGFKFRDSYDGFNESGGTYIGIAFASNPFVSSKGIPVTAK